MAKPENTRTRSQRLTDEAINLVTGARLDAYGGIVYSMSQVALVWTGLLAGKLAPGERITPEDVPILLAGMKLCRETHKAQRDNRIDAIGYVLLSEELAATRQALGTE